MLVSQHQRHPVRVVIRQAKATHAECADDVVHERARCKVWEPTGGDEDAWQASDELVVDEATEDLCKQHDGTST